MGAAASIIGGLLIVMFNLLSQFEAEIFTTAVILSGIGILIISGMLPLAFKFGVEKGRMLMMAC